MTSKPKALVIGAGIGGIAAAGRLARNGFQVTVVEKNDQPGGRCNQINRDGHRFDIGPTLFLMPEVFAETYTALGERMEDHLDLRRIDPTYTVHFSDGLSLQLTADLLKMQAQLDAVEKDGFDGFLRYFAEEIPQVVARSACGNPRSSMRSIPLNNSRSMSRSASL